MSVGWDVVVVGAGPSGLAAATELRRRGVRRVLVVDREAEAGGVPRHCAHTGYGVVDLHRLTDGPGYATRTVARALDAGATLMTSTTATRWTPAGSLELAGPWGVDEVRAAAVVLATGARERPRAARLVPGDRPDGVLTTGALQLLVSDRVARGAIGRRAVVVGAEHVSYSALLTLRHAGTTVVAMVTDQPRHQTHAAFHAGARLALRVPMRTRCTVTRIVGHGRVEAVEVTGPDGSVSEIACDTVVFTGDWIPDNELARAGGLAMDRSSRGPVVDTALATDRHGVFAAGNLVHPAETAGVAAASGRHAARSVVRWLDWAGEPRAPRHGLRLTVEPPLVWVSPGVVVGAVAPPSHRFRLRCDQVVPDAHLVVSQGGRVLADVPRRTLVPHRSLSLPSGWLPLVDAYGPDLVVSVR